MADPDQIFRWAEEAVAEIVVQIDPKLDSRWLEVTPTDLGLNRDDWLQASKEMVIAFNALAGTAISLSAPSRAQYHSRDLIEFVGAVADAAEQVL